MEKEDRHGTDRERDLAADLRRLLDAGIIDTEAAARLLEKADEMKKEKIEKEHKRKIFQSGGYWMTYYRDEAGKQHRIKRKTKKEVCAVLEEILYPSSPQVKAVFTEWNDSRLSLGHITGSTHLRDIKFYRQFYQGTEIEARRIDTVTAREWADWLQAKLDAGIPAKAWAGLRGITRGMIKYAGKHDWIDYPAAAVFDRVEIYKNAFQKKRKEDSEEIYYPEELAALRAYCEENWDAYTSCLWLISMTGMRIGEAVALKPGDVDLDHMTVRVQRTETNGDDLEGTQTITVREDTKTAAGTREVSLPLSARERLQMIRDRAVMAGWEWLFCRDGGERIEGRAARKVLVRACRETGVPYRPPHKLRKTIASILIESDEVDSRTVIRQLGHVDMGITEAYYHRDRKRALERAEALDRVAEIGNVTGK